MPRAGPSLAWSSASSAIRARPTRTTRAATPRASSPPSLPGPPEPQPPSGVRRRHWATISSPTRAAAPSSQQGRHRTCRPGPPTRARSSRPWATVVRGLEAVSAPRTTTTAVRATRRRHAELQRVRRPDAQAHLAEQPLLLGEHQRIGQLMDGEDLVVTAANAWGSAQQSWLTTTLAQKTTYTFVVRHEPSDATPPLPPGVAGVDAALANAPYTLLLTGHSHTYGHWSSAPKVVVIGNGGSAAVEQGLRVRPHQPALRRRHRGRRGRLQDRRHRQLLPLRREARRHRHELNPGSVAPTLYVWHPPGRCMTR